MGAVERRRRRRRRGKEREEEGKRGVGRRGEEMLSEPEAEESALGSIHTGRGCAHPGGFRIRVLWESSAPEAPCPPPLTVRGVRPEGDLDGKGPVGVFHGWQDKEGLRVLGEVGHHPLCGARKGRPWTAAQGSCLGCCPPHNRGREGPPDLPRRRCPRQGEDGGQAPPQRINSPPRPQQCGRHSLGVGGRAGRSSHLAP